MSPALEPDARHGGVLVPPEPSGAVARVQQKLPGARIVSEVQAWAYLQEFEEGIRCYERLANPSAADDRWVGVCHFQLIDDVLALQYFDSAIAKGEQAARINRVHLLRFLERADETSSEFRSIDVPALSEYDRVFFYRIVSLDEENNGNLREALKAAEEAWRQVQSIPEYGILAPAILAQLGLLHSRIGRAQRALWFLDRALQITEGKEHTKTRLRRALVLQLLGRNNESLTELEALDRQGIPSAFVPELQFYRGELLWAARRIDLADTAFQLAIEIAHEHQLVYEEFIASLSLVGISLLTSRVDAAKLHLSRAQALVSDKTDRLNFRFREIQVLRATGVYSAAHAEHELHALDEEFMNMGLLQEQAYVKLHRAAGYSSC